ncbi:Transmembrane protein 41A [Mortierella sp. AM989]|nr:Transmembrane protein 41A [Mortierella sp. AM989]
MATFIATASTTSTLTASALGRFHGNLPARQRSSSITAKGNKASLAHSSPVDAQPHLLPPKWLANNNHSPNKGLNQKEKIIGLSDLSALLSESNNSVNTTHQGPTDRINLVPSSTDHSLNSSYIGDRSTAHQTWMQSSSPQDQNSDLSGDHVRGNSPTICTGRSRSNTLTTTSTGAVDVAAAAISNQLDHVIRPRRPSLVNRPSAPNIHSMPVLPSINLPVTAPSHTLYPPESTLPQYHLVQENNDNTIRPKLFSIPSWSNIQLGFLPRIILLIGIFGSSLGGLYLLAQVLPPLSLPKSIDDVKVDAAILQEFATATYEGWIRTFWVFSIVYMWKQCFGIPGSAFLNILAGALYGPWFGTVLTSLLTTLGSVLAYFMSFFLMEPILNRYASSRLDQMRLQIQKKAMNSSKKKRRSSAATSSGAQLSINALTAQSPDVATPNSFSVPSSNQGSQLRPRAASFTSRRTDNADLNTQTHYSFPNISNMHVKHNEIEYQENDNLRTEDRENENPALPIGQHNGVSSDQDTDEEDEDESEGTSLFMQLLLIRLFPLTPYWFINLASPLVGVPVVPFMTSMFLGCMPYNYICAQAGAILSEIRELHDIYRQPWILFQIVLVLVLSTAAVFISKRTKKKQMDSEERKNRSSEDQTVGDEATHHLLRSDFEDADQYHNQQYRSEQHPAESISMSSLDSQQTSDLGNNKRDSAVINMY